LKPARAASSHQHSCRHERRDRRATALDGLFNHPNVPPFRQQAADPAPGNQQSLAAYVGRVASVFANNGAACAAI